MKTMWTCLPVLLALALPVHAQEGNGPTQLPAPVEVKLDAYSGCWHSRQEDFRFVVRIGNPGHLLIELREPDSKDTGERMGGRDPYLSQIDQYGNVLGTVPLNDFGRHSVTGYVTKGVYFIDWAPRASWGTKVLATFCFSRNPDRF